MSAILDANDGASLSNEPSPLWRHSSPTTSRLYEFKELINKKHNIQLESYEELFQWSLGNLSVFWEEVWHFTGVTASQPFHTVNIVRQDAPLFPRPQFFEGARLNFAENLLYPSSSPDDGSLAVIEATEVSRVSVSWRELRVRVRQCAAAMSSIGVIEGNRVAGFLANHTNALVAMLSAASIGAIWTGVSPDTGVHAVLDRLQQITPVLLFADNAVLYNGKTHDVQGKVREIIQELPDLKGVVIFETTAHSEMVLDDLRSPSRQSWKYADFVDLGDAEGEIQFAQLQPDHPVYILYSSGTTGSE